MFGLSFGHSIRLSGKDKVRKLLEEKWTCRKSSKYKPVGWVSISESRGLTKVSVCEVTVHYKPPHRTEYNSAP